MTAKGWYDWHNDFVIKGNNDSSKEKNGVITFLSPNRSVELARIELGHLGIYRIEADKAEANADQIKRVVAYLYCESMSFSYVNKVIADKAAPSASAGTATAAASPSIAIPSASSGATAPSMSSSNVTVATLSLLE